MARNILIFADGTGNEGGLLPDESRTNIYKLYRAPRVGRTQPSIQQIRSHSTFRVSGRRVSRLQKWRDAS
jgi:hypothetical protein